MAAVASTEKDKLLRELRRLSERQRALVRRMSRDEELADAIAQDLVELERDLREGSFGNPGDGATKARRHRSVETGRVLRIAAEAGVTSLKMSKRADGSVRVRIDGSQEFELPPALADLLWVLAQDSGRSEDGLIGWKTPDEAAILLAKKQGRTSSKHALTQNIYRLRTALADRGGVNPFLVQTHRRLGVRFALRRERSSAALENPWVGREIP
jgi:hypothetical protein